jgi:hypothetical protein
LTCVKGPCRPGAILMSGLQAVKDLGMFTDKPAISAETLSGLFAPGLEYPVDTGQHSVLFFDVMRERGLQCREHIAETAPHVLNYEVELIVDGRSLPRPVNYTSKIPSMLAKNLAYFAKADGAGILLGARVPIVLTSRADSARSRMASCAFATRDADGRRRRVQIVAA